MKSNIQNKQSKKQSQKQPTTSTRSKLLRTTTQRRLRTKTKARVTRKENNLEPSILRTSTLQCANTFQTRQFSSQTAEEFISRETSAVFENKLLAEGAGAQVRRSIGRQPRYFSPFPLLDHFYLTATPAEIQSGNLKGFPPHGHRGLATFTMMKKGHVKHKDSKGNEGVIGPGDCQYLRTAKGIVHSEMPHFPEGHGDGPIHVEGMQLWFNLPKKLKMAEPLYQDISASQIPVITENNITAHVIMGKAMGAESPITTDTPAHYINYILGPNEVVEHQLPAHWNTFAYVIEGDLVESGSNKTPVPLFHTVFFKEGLDAAQCAMAAASVCEDQFDLHRNQGVRLKAGPHGADFILVGAEPLDPAEGVYQHGPFVLNSRSELQAAMNDFENSINGFEGAQEWIDNWHP